MRQAPTKINGADMPPVRGAPSTLEQQLLGQILETLKTMPDQMRQSQTDHLWGEIPVTIEESAINLNAVAGSVLTVQPQTGGLELYTFIAATVPAGSTGILQIGNGTWQYPFPAGVTVLPFMRKFAFAGDRRILTIVGGAGGAAGILMMGEQRPTIGMMSP